MIKDISNISDLPEQTVEEYRKRGWTDEEIVENLNDAISYLNSNLNSMDSAAIISPRIVFSYPPGTENQGSRSTCSPSGTVNGEKKA